MLTGIVETENPALQELERIFQEHYDLVYRTAYTITRSAEDAEDIAQTIFLRLLRREFIPGVAANLKGYLYKSAVNGALQANRSRKRQFPVDAQRDVAQPSTSGMTDIDEAIDQRLWAAISELHETAAQAVILRYIQGHSVTETARVLGKSRSAVAVTLFRSRARLKKLIGKAEGEH